MFNLNSLGWSEFFSRQLEASELESEIVVGRVVEEQREQYLIACEYGEIWAHIAGRMRHQSVGSSDYPAVGDWVALRAQGGIIVRVLDRRSKFSRSAPQNGEEQIIAANVDIAFVVTAMGGDHNVRRIERYVTLVWESGATPVVLLTKTDLCDNLDAVRGEIESVAPGIAIIATSAVQGDGIEHLRAAIPTTRTAVLVGSSGTGKSTLVNALLGSDVQYVSEISGYKDKGRHTTTSRKLLQLPTGGMIIDTPGMRELQLWDVEDGLSKTFEDIERIISQCKFTNCRHESEPGCAVKRSLEDGTLDAGRYRGYIKLQREALHQAMQTDARLARQVRDQWKKRGQEARKRARW